MVSGCSEHIHFVTGRLAEHALRPVLASLAARVGFTYTIDVLPITVAALMTPSWIARHVRIPAEAKRVIIPGYCEGDSRAVQSLTRPSSSGAARSARSGRILRPASDWKTTARTTLRSWPRSIMRRVCRWRRFWRRRIDCGRAAPT